MSIIVKGMQIPENCRECPFENYHSDIGQTVCMASLRVLATGFKTISFDGRHCSCPLVALPDHHGRLVDAGECEKYFWEHLDDNGMAGAMNAINEMPTIVESEGEE